MVGVVQFNFNGRPHAIRAYSDEDYRLPDSGVLKIELEGVGVVYTCGTYFHGRALLYTSIDSLRPLLEASLKATAQPGFVPDGYKYCLPFATHERVANNDGSWNLTDVDLAPEFPGGFEKLQEHMVRIQQYPDSEFNARVEGKVFVQFTVNEDGSLDNITVLRSISPGLDKEAVRLIASMPNWTVAKLEGKLVRCRVVLPIAFKLTSDS
jgi:TonB family protein